MYDHIQHILAENIALRRMAVGISQRELADRLTAISGRNVSAYIVSTWENNHAVIPAAMMPAITEALGCSSYDLYPHSRRVTERDFRLLGEIKQKPDRIRRILDFIMTMWDGDDEAFWEFGLLYAVLDRSDRKYIAQIGLEHYLDTLENYPDTIDEADGLTVDVRLLKRATKALDKK